MSDIMDDKAYIEELRQQIAELRQQLAQERKDYHRAIIDMQAMIDHAQLQAQEHAAMRALLEELASMDYRLAKLADLIELQEKTRTFLTVHPQEASNGE